MFHKRLRFWPGALPPAARLPPTAGVSHRVSNPFAIVTWNFCVWVIEGQMRQAMLQRISRSLWYRKEALAVWLLTAVAVAVQLAGKPTMTIVPSQPQALPPLRTVQPPPTTSPITPALPPTTGTAPPTTGTIPPPTMTGPATTEPPTTGPPTRPGQVGEPQGEPAQEPPPPTSVPPTTAGPTPTTAGPPPTTTTIPQTTAPTVAEVVCQRPGPTSAPPITYKGPPVSTHLADGHILCIPTH